MRRELVAMLKLAGPVVLAEIGWMCMGIVDIYGHVGFRAMGTQGSAWATCLARSRCGTPEVELHDLTSSVMLLLRRP